MVKRPQMGPEKVDVSSYLYKALLDLAEMAEDLGERLRLKNFGRWLWTWHLVSIAIGGSKKRACSPTLRTAKKDLFWRGIGW